MEVELDKKQNTPKRRIMACPSRGESERGCEMVGTQEQPNVSCAKAKRGYRWSITQGGYNNPMISSSLESGPD